jgi:hypothetical protein
MRMKIGMAQLRTRIRRTAWLLFPLWLVVGSPTMADSESANSRSVGEQFRDTAEKVGNKIEQGVSKIAKKIESKHIVEKVEKKLNKAASKTAEGFKKAGKKIDQKLQ